VRVVGTHDPLGPGEIFDRVPEVRKLPVHEGRYLAAGVEQHVLRAEVAMHQHRALSRLAERLAEDCPVQPPRRPSDLVEDRHRHSFQQFLARYAGQISDHDSAGVMLEQRWHRKPARQRLERPDFPAQTLFPVRSEVPLHDGWFAGGRTVAR
jgi:hypothetical protein